MSFFIDFTLIDTEYIGITIQINNIKKNYTTKLDTVRIPQHGNVDRVMSSCALEQSKQKSPIFTLK